MEKHSFSAIISARFLHLISKLLPNRKGKKHDDGNLNVWNFERERMVLVGSLKNREQLDVCLKYGFYHIPTAIIPDCPSKLRIVALYQSKTLFGAEAGIRYYGEVQSIQIIPRNEIRELPSTRRVLYYYITVKEWKKLEPIIAPKELAPTAFLTNLFLFHSARELPELLCRDIKTVELYRAIRRLCGGQEMLQVKEFSFEVNNGQCIISYSGNLLGCWRMEYLQKYPFRCCQEIDRQRILLENT